MKRLSIILVLFLLLTGCVQASSAENNGTTNTANTQTAQSDVSYYFARQTPNVDQQLIKVIDSSESTLDIAIYSLTKQNIVDAIINAKNNGKTVRIITDRQESKTKAEAKELAKLKAAGIPIKINSHSGLMHMKVTIADKSVVTTGSYNYTEAATKENDEVLVIINNSTTATDFDNEFIKMWNDNTNYKVY